MRKAISKLNKEEQDMLMGQSLINTICLSYTYPEIKSKYSLAANILYLLKVEIGSDTSNFHRIPQFAESGNSQQYELLVRGLLQGFEKHYKMDLKDLEYLQNLSQNELIKEQNQQPVPDLINMELFFIILIQIETNMKTIISLEKEINKYTQQRVEELSNENKIQGKSGGQHNTTSEKSYNKKLADLGTSKKSLWKQVQTLTKLIADSDGDGQSSFDVYFNYQRSKAREFEQDHKVEKTQVQRNQYYIPAQKEDIYTYEPNLRNKEYQVDIMNHGKDGGQDILLKHHSYKDANIIYLQNMDKTQKDWFTRPPLMVNHLRGKKNEEGQKGGFDGVLVPNKKKDEKRSEDYIDREILKFRRFQKKQMLMKENNKITEEQAEYQVFYEEMMRETPYLLQDKTPEMIQRIVNSKIQDENQKQKEAEQKKKERQQKEDYQARQKDHDEIRELLLKK